LCPTETSNFGPAAQNRQSSENAPDKGGFGPERVIFGHQANEKRPFLRVGKQLVAAREALRRRRLATRERLKSYNLAD
jgi:hypothetical protein